MPSMQFPTELMIEVLRYKALKEQDLYNCCLLSRRYLDAAREQLYQSIPVDLIPTKEEEERRPSRDGPVQQLELTSRSRKALRTLMNSDNGLARYIKHLSFSVSNRNSNLFEEEEEEEEEEETPAILQTTRFSAVSTFVRLVPNLRSADFSREWEHTEEELELLGRHGIDELDFGHLSPEVLTSVAAQFPKLKAIRVWTFQQNGAVRAAARFEEIERLELDYYDGPIENFDCLVNGSTTLRTLAVPLDIALYLNYTKFPALRELVLYDCHDEDPSQQLDLCRRFSRALALSTSLECLTFAPGPGPQDIFGKGLFTALEELEGPIPTLRTIRFDHPLVLDRVVSIMSHPFATSLHRVCIPFSPWARKMVQETVVRARAVSGMCQGAGIDLVYSDRFFG